MSTLTGLKRDATTDKFYTSAEVVDLLMEHFTTIVPITLFDLIIEPSAGNGAFIPSIKAIDCENVFYDVEPEHGDIIQLDYLQLNLAHEFLRIGRSVPSRKIHILGNPPFGRQSSIAIKFIKHSATIADTIAFILPKSFKKLSMQKAFPLEFHKVFEIDIPDNAFLVNNIVHDVPCVFQIWIKRDEPREIIPRPIPIGYNFVKITDCPDVAIRRVGVYAGELNMDWIDKSVQSHYFIKFTNGISAEKNVDILKTITYEFNNTVGPKSLSKDEITTAFNERLSRSADM